MTDQLAATILPPPQTCSCCARAISTEEWMTNATRRHWADLSLEILECRDCRSTLARAVNEDLVRAA